SLSNNITGNTITTNGGDGIGILFLGSSSNTLQSNTITTNGSTGVGIFLDTGSSNNNISLNNISSNKSYAINLASGTGNQLIENRVTSDLDYALAADDNLIKCDEERGVINITSAGAYSNTNISNCTTILVTKGNSFFNRIRVINNSYGFNITNIIKVNITNISVENSLYYDFIINKSEVTLLNSTFSNYLIETGNLTVKLFLKFNITNSTGQIINNSYINISDNFTGVYETIFNGTVNETLPYWLEIYDYFDNSSFIFDYGLNITVNNSGYFDNSAIYDFSYSQVLGIVMQALGGGAVTFCNGAYTQGSGSWNITTLVICTLQNFIVNGRIIWDLNGNLVMNQSNITAANLSINKQGKFLNMSIGS
ncbi:MAG TPA: right-handed parallel beta-helix repeat-containing protein, partial [Candidatus Nanoarchaeia archaeon]|nr:right-handed parallel beta-helix repeat-containing protein [Candidatus Nanoarchaeia archaeon]